MFWTMTKQARRKQRQDLRTALAAEELEQRDVPSTFQGNQVFPLNNPWNQNISAAPVASNSDAMVTTIGTTRKVHLDFGDIYGIPINVISNSSPGVTTPVAIDAYWDESDNVITFASNPTHRVNLPVPTNARIEGDPDNSGGDRHMLIYNRDTNILYETYATSRPSTNGTTYYHADQNSYWDLNVNSFRPVGYTSTDAAGLPVMPGLLRPDEVIAAVDQGAAITHAFRFTVQQSRGDFVFPASHEASSLVGTQYARMGERFRLKASFVIPSNWSPEAKAVAQAMKNYGMIVADNGSNWFITGEMNDQWADPRFANFYSQLQSIAGSNFEAVDLTPVVTGLSAASGSTAGGNTITINGLNFSGNAGKLHVFFGATEATSFTVVSDTQIIVTTPAHAAGQIDIIVKQGDLNASGNVTWGYGASANTAADNFTFGATGSAPSITGQPISLTVLAGQTASFSVTASGTGTLTYQWQRSNDGGSTWSNVGSNASGYTTAATVAGDNAARFRVNVTNASGTTTSASATLTVNFVPAITTQPANRTVNTGQTATFSVTATGNPAPTYQWQRSNDGGTTWANISGATAASYTTAATVAGDSNARFRVNVTNSVGTAASAAAVLTVNVAPSFAAQPTSQTVNAGQIATFSVAAGGSPPPTLQWQRSNDAGATWTNISGATSGSYSLTTAAGDTNARFRAVATNAAGSATSAAATLTVNSAPAITGQPVNQTVNAGQAAAFSVTATGNPAPTYQWQRSNDAGSTWTNISGATAATYSFNAAAGDNNARFRAVASNAAGSATSAAATLTVTLAPVITGQPANRTVNAGQTAAFTVTATGIGLTYQWQRSNDAGTTWTNISGATAATYTTAATVAGDSNARFRVNVTNAGGTTTSNSATLTVNVAPAITGQPANQSVNVGQAATFSVTATGSPTPTYQWQQSNDAGTTWANISGATAASYTTAATVAGDNNARFRAVVSNAAGSITSAAAILTVATAPATGAFQQDSGANGLAVMEAENAQANVGQGGKNWVAYSATSGFAGAGAMITPSTGVSNDTGYTTTSPRLDFQVNFTKTGTHYIWVRGLWPTSDDNSVHVGLDGAAVASADRISNETLSATGYTWTNSTRDGVRATINVTTTGLHTINLWMREDGTIVDRVLLTTNANYTPSGIGPAESPRSGGAVGTGLTATYFDNKDFTGASVSRVDSSVNFNWGSGSPAAAIAADTFSARWTGKIQAPVSGTYTFYTTSDDGVRLWVNGQLLIDQWNDHAPTVHSGTIALQAGQLYDIKIEYYENAGGAVMQLEWANVAGGLPRQFVPQSRLFAN